MIDTYTEFWDFYVREHSKPATRLLHFVGTLLGLLLLSYFVATGRWYLFLIFPLVGYAFAWFAHFVVEKLAVGGRTKTTVHRLDVNEHVREVARLMSGEGVTESSLQMARELIGN